MKKLVKIMKVWACVPVYMMVSVVCIVSLIGNTFEVAMQMSVDAIGSETMKEFSNKI